MLTRERKTAAISQGEIERDLARWRRVVAKRTRANQSMSMDFEPSARCRHCERPIRWHEKGCYFCQG